MPFTNYSGSFVRGNYSGRALMATGVTRDLTFSGGTLGYSMVTRDLTFSAGTVGFISSSNELMRRGAYGYAQGIAFTGNVTSMNSDAPGGKHYQIGVGKNTTDGSPLAPCLQLDYPGSWRFRWVIKGPAKTVSVQTKQNSTGSYRPSMVVKANPDIGIPFDVSASAADGGGWILIGPISVNPTGTGSVWVELHNNNVVYPTAGYENNETLHPALFDHIVTT